jgi:hypothetical protein
MVPPLSYGSQFGYYGLRVNPTLEQVISTVRKPLRIPLPDRSHKWYALSPYRAHILDAAQKQLAHERGGLDYRDGGAELPEAAARVMPWEEAADDGMFREIHRQGDAMALQTAFEAAVRNTREEQRRETEVTRRQQLLYSHGPNYMNPVIEAAHAELEQAGVQHYMPEPRFAPPVKGWKTPNAQMAAAGQPQAPEFPTFEFLNMGQPHNVRAATLSHSQNMTYEHVRDFVAQPTWSS